MDYRNLLPNELMRIVEHYVKHNRMRDSLERYRILVEELGTVYTSIRDYAIEYKKISYCSLFFRSLDGGLSFDIHFNDANVAEKYRCIYAPKLKDRFEITLESNYTFTLLTSGDVISDNYSILYMIESLFENGIYANQCPYIKIDGYEDFELDVGTMLKMK